MTDTNTQVQALIEGPVKSAEQILAQFGRKQSVDYNDLALTDDQAKMLKPFIEFSTAEKIVAADLIDEVLGGDESISPLVHELDMKAAQKLVKKLLKIFRNKSKADAETISETENLTDAQKEIALDIFNRLAQGEGEVDRISVLRAAVFATAGISEGIPSPSDINELLGYYDEDDDDDGEGGEEEEEEEATGEADDSDEEADDEELAEEEEEDDEPEDEDEDEEEEEDEEDDEDEEEEEEEEPAPVRKSVTSRKPPKPKKK